MAGAVLRIGVEAAKVYALQQGMQTAARHAEEFQRSIGRANDRIQAMAQIAAGGGTAGQGGALAGLARLTGEDPNGVAGAARGFREHLAGSPMAQASLGAGALPAQSGQLVNEAQLYLRAQQQILDARTQEEARVRAQVYGLEQLLPLRDADRRLVEQQMRLSQENGQMVDEEMRKRRANLQAERAILDERMERIGLAWEKYVTLPVVGFFADVGKWVADHLPGLGGSAGKGSAQSQHTAAVNANTEALQALRKDFLNGRERVAGAWPRNLGGEGLKRALENQAFDLGAVTF